MQAWKLFVTENIIDKVNQQINTKKISAVFGLLYKIGSSKTSHVNLEGLYVSNEASIPLSEEKLLTTQ